jgi:hypothetical protein
LRIAAGPSAVVQVEIMMALEEKFEITLDEEGEWGLTREAAALQQASAPGSTSAAP